MSDSKQNKHLIIGKLPFLCKTILLFNSLKRKFEINKANNLNISSQKSLIYQSTMSQQQDTRGNSFNYRSREQQSNERGYQSTSSNKEGRKMSQNSQQRRQEPTSSQVQEAIIDLYLQVKIRSHDEVSGSHLLTDCRLDRHH